MPWHKTRTRGEVLAEASCHIIRRMTLRPCHHRTRGIAGRCWVGTAVARWLAALLQL